MVSLLFFFPAKRLGIGGEKWGPQENLCLFKWINNLRSFIYQQAMMHIL